MSIRVMSAVWAMDLPAKDKLVLLALADCANDEGIAWPSIATLARKCGCDERTIQRNLRGSELAGIIRREEVPGRGNRYHFNPRQIATPGKSSPVTKTTKTPGKLPPKPSRTVNTKEKRAHDLPDNWQPLPFTEETESRKVVDGWPPGELERNIEAFTAHHRARGNRFKDWQQAWSTWVLNSRKFGNGKQANSNGRASEGRGGSTRTAAQIALERLHHCQ